MKNFKKHIALFSAGALASLNSMVLLAQSRDPSSILTTANSSIKAIGSPLVNTVSIILGLIGIVMLVPTFVKYLRNEPTSSDAFIKHGGGYLIAVILLQVFRLVALS